MPLPLSCPERIWPRVHHKQISKGFYFAPCKNKKSVADGTHARRKGKKQVGESDLSPHISVVLLKWHRQKTLFMISHQKVNIKQLLIASLAFSCEIKQLCDCRTRKIAYFQKQTVSRSELVTFPCLIQDGFFPEIDVVGSFLLWNFSCHHFSSKNTVKTIASPDFNIIFSTVNLM